MGLTKLAEIRALDSEYGRKDLGPAGPDDDLGQRISTYEKSPEETAMAKEILNVLGLRCPHPILEITIKSPRMNPGDILEVLGDCPTFEAHVRGWCNRLGKAILDVKDEGRRQKRIQIQF